MSQVVSLAAVFSLVTQRSSPQTDNIPFLCSLCTNEITEIVSYVTNQSTGDCNQHRFSRVLKVTHSIVVNS